MKIKMALAACLIVAVCLADTASANPLDTHPAKCLASKKFELDFKLKYSKISDTTIPAGDNVYSLPRIDLRVGIGNKVELLAYGEGLYVERDGLDNEWDSGDVYFWTKFSLYDKPKKFFKISGLVGAKIPSADDQKGLGTDEADVFALVALGHYEKKFNLDINLGIGILGNTQLRNNELKKAQRDVLMYGLSYEFTPGKIFSVFGELTGHVDIGEQEHQSKITAGVAFDLKRMKYYVSFSKGLTDYTPDWTAQLGFTLKF